MKHDSFRPTSVLFVLVFLVAGTAVGEVPEQESRFPAKTPYYDIRNNLPNTFYRCVEDPLKQDDYRGQIVFYGDESLKRQTPKDGTTHADAIFQGFKKLYPEARISLNRHPGPQGSWYGSFRAARAVPVYGETIFSATAAFLDFVPADDGKPLPELLDSWEGMVRSILTFRPDLDVVLIYRPSAKIIDEYVAGKIPEIIPLLEKIADHYGVASLNLARYAADKVASGTLSKNDLFAGDASLGHTTFTSAAESLFAEAAWDFVRALDVAQPEERSLVRRVLPEPISRTNRGNAKIVGYETADCSDGWEMGIASPIASFRHVLVTDTSSRDKAGAEISLKFKGTEIGLLDVLDDRSPQYEWLLDGGDWQFLQLETGPVAAPMLRITKIAGRLDANEEHVLKLRIAANQENKTARIGAFLLDGSLPDPYAGMSPLEKADAVYATMAPVAYAPPKDRWKFIPKTMETLKNGGDLRIVLLGDSIIGDTSSSHFEKILRREYPKCRIEKILSNRSSTGCRWYKEENRVENYVLKYKPDLLIIGGISNGDAESVREVVRQVRAKQSPEIVLMTPVFGTPNGRHLYDPEFDADKEQAAFRAGLKKVAEEEGCEFIDLTSVTWRYMKDSGKCYGWFMRDRVHADDRGFQVIGRPLVRYFLPD